ncbi:MULTISPECIES: pyruvate dehydrogenase complex transcriptional repressor PdhR [Corallincola]|uniref:Pyruvate dehydrogenase complex repressor n=3 Tax=Corallincola TaxID=1775176 RepID=A0A368NJG4_9GAMM|nr:MULTISPECIES: pyruvate dehydrogenase complex transcriptional repressor PdhR [Corallincola]RCU49905.1 pyruvate dehydrogenase complex transcriptional repressor PdhR [Corallincola holothuriorum]TAA45115.1 pyruvate dehydrogenase complex transcriptional repressor PdhR [Corallincola spongiicola]TCI03607.1 pyruvate dehydrogenase complex transcriptional repressor PdhR [Corallincola luteus]
MTFQKIKQPRIADVIVEQLEQMILEGSMKPGQKLLPERELAAQFEVSRPSLREAIQKLEARGLLVRRQGGGTFVAEKLRDSVSEPLFELLAKNPEAQFDLLEFRLAMEGISAYYAAVRGTEADFAQLESCSAAINQAHEQGDAQAEAQAVIAFYERIAEASHNVVILQLVLAMRPLLLGNVEQNLHVLYRKSGVASTLAEHRRLVLAAIVQRQPEQARQATLSHLAYIEETLLLLGQESNRQQRSLRRMQQQDESESNTE